MHYYITKTILILVIYLFNGVNSKSSDYEEQILSLNDGINQIKKFIFGPGKHGAYDRLAEMGDTYGHRLAGSQSLENAIDWVKNQMKDVDKFDAVDTEIVKINKWVRGKQSAKLILPWREQTMSILSLGSSVGTNVSLEAPVIVVRSFEELDRRKDEVAGKIVVYNEAWVGYGGTVAYRSSGAWRASQYNAVATLIKSVTDFSIYSPHTGSQTYNTNFKKIPTACITVEDAEMLQRLFDRNVKMTIELDIATENTIAESKNVVGELKGTDYPEQVIIFGGHIDTWDVGTGSMDDGGGCLIAWQALKILKELNLKTKRSLRVVLWTAEEIGLVGGLEYYNRHKNTSENVSLIMESDNGVFKPRGIRFAGTKEATKIMQFTLDTYLKEYNMTEIATGGASSDTRWWVENDQVPGIELFSYNEKYFYFHHSEGDTMTVLNADDLDYATLLWTTIVYVVGNLDDMLPRVESSTSGASSHGLPLPLHFLKLIGQLFKWPPAH